MESAYWTLSFAMTVKLLMAYLSLLTRNCKSALKSSTTSMGSDILTSETTQEEDKEGRPKVQE